VVHSFFRGLFKRAFPVFGVHAGVAFRAPAFPRTVYTATCEEAVSTGTSGLDIIEKVSKSDDEKEKQDFKYLQEPRHDEG
jgi:hypothetical protein